MTFFAPCSLKGLKATHFSGSKAKIAPRLRGIFITKIDLIGLLTVITWSSITHTSIVSVFWEDCHQFSGILLFVSFPPGSSQSLSIELRIKTCKTKSNRMRCKLASFFNTGHISYSNILLLTNSLACYLLYTNHLELLILQKTVFVNKLHWENCQPQWFK